MSATRPHIGIVTVLYNSEKVLDEFFATLGVQTYKEFTLYVVDNASPDGSLAKARALAAEAPFRTVVVPEPDNGGVARGNNTGIRRALEDGCGCVLLSNNDVVLEPSTIEALYAGMTAAGASMAVPKIYFHDTGLIWAAGGVWDMMRGVTAHLGLREEDRGQRDVSGATDYAPTCFMLIDAAVFGRVGMMDESYFVYYDDTDFVWRATVRGDEKLVYIHSSRLWHKESTSTGGWGGDFTIYYFHRNAVYFARKHFSFARRCAVYGFWAVNYLLRKSFTMSAAQRAIVRRAYRDGMKMKVSRQGRCNS